MDTVALTFILSLLILIITGCIYDKIIIIRSKKYPHTNIKIKILKINRNNWLIKDGSRYVYNTKSVIIYEDILNKKEVE